MVQFVLKTSYQGDIRRLTFDSVEQVSFESIRTFAAKSYDVQDFLAKYQDEEGDWCTLTAATLSDAMDLVKDKHLLRLEVQAAGSRSPSTLPAPVGAVGAVGAAAAATSPRSPSVCSWEMLDFDAEDEDMEIEESAPTEVTQVSAGEVSESLAPDELPTEFPKGLESSTPSGAESEDSFLVAEAPASVDETSAGDDECFVLEPIEATAPEENVPIPIDVDQEMPDVQPSAPALSLATEAAPEPPECAGAEELAELASEEKINLILAAFDKNGDGRLNFEETIDLLMWAYGELIPFEVFKMTCDELRVDPQQGFGASELTRLYDCFGTLERDFQAALRKLSHEPPPAAPAAAAAAAPPPSSEGVSNRISPWVALPLLPICPVAAGAVALAATLRNRACQ